MMDSECGMVEETDEQTSPWAVCHSVVFFCSKGMIEGVVVFLFIWLLIQVLLNKHQEGADLPIIHLSFPACTLSPSDICLICFLFAFLTTLLAFIFSLLHIFFIISLFLLFFLLQLLKFRVSVLFCLKKIHIHSKCGII